MLFQIRGVAHEAKLAVKVAAVWLQFSGWTVDGAKEKTLEWLKHAAAA